MQLIESILEVFPKGIPASAIPLVIEYVALKLQLEKVIEQLNSVTGDNND